MGPKRKGKGGSNRKAPSHRQHAAEAAQDVANDQTELHPLLDHLQSLAPMDRVNAIKPWWNEQSLSRREELLTVDVESLRAAAKDLEEAARRQLADAARWQAGPVPEDPYLQEQLHMTAGLETALEQLRQRGSWKVWHCHLDGRSFYDAEAFRTHIVAEHLEPGLRELLPKLDAKENEREEGLRKRMTKLMDQVSTIHHKLHRSCCDHYYSGCCGHPSCAWCQAPAAGAPTTSSTGAVAGGSGTGASSSADGAGAGARSTGGAGPWSVWQDSGAGGANGRRRNNGNNRGRSCNRRPVPAGALSGGHDGSAARSCACCGGACSSRELEIEIVSSILDGLQHEHPYLRHMVLGPLLDFVEKALPEAEASSRSGYLHLDDLGRLLPEDRLHICEWLTEKVDALCAQLKPNSKEDDEDEHDDMGDIDLWCLSPDDRLRVNPRWLMHLQQRLLSEDGPPRKSQPGEDPHSTGLVLEWVYGCIVSTAEKARDASQRCLSPSGPGLARAWSCLEEALKLQQGWQTLLSEARALIDELRDAASAAAAAGVYCRDATGSKEQSAVAVCSTAGDRPVCAEAHIPVDNASLELQAHRGYNIGAQEQAWLLAAAADGVEPVLATAAATALGAMAANGAAAATAAQSNAVSQGQAAHAKQVHPLLWPGDEAMACALRLELTRLKGAAHALVCEASVAGQALAATGPRLRLYEPSLQGLTRQLEDCVAERMAAGNAASAAVAAATAAGAGAGAGGGGTGGTAAATLERLMQIEALLRASVLSRGGASGSSASSGGAHRGEGAVADGGMAGGEKLKTLEEGLARRVLQLRKLCMQQSSLERACQALDHLLALKQRGDDSVVGRNETSRCNATVGTVPRQSSPGAVAGEDLASTVGCDACSSGSSPASVSHHLTISSANASTSECCGSSGSGSPSGSFIAGPCADPLLWNERGDAAEGLSSRLAPAVMAPGVAESCQSRAIASGEDPALCSFRPWAEDSGLQPDQHRRLCVLRLYCSTLVLPAMLFAAPNQAVATPACELTELLMQRLERAAEEVQHMLEEGRAALSHLEHQLINIQCMDPGATVGLQLVLPLLQHRLDVEAARHQQASVQDLISELIAQEEEEKRQKELQQQQRRQGKKAQRQQQQPGKPTAPAVAGLAAEGAVAASAAHGNVTGDPVAPAPRQGHQPYSISAPPAALAAAAMAPVVAAGEPHINGVSAAGSTSTHGDGESAASHGRGGSASSTCSCCSISSATDPVAVLQSCTRGAEPQVSGKAAGHMQGKTARVPNVDAAWPGRTAGKQLTGAAAVDGASKGVKQPATTSTPSAAAPQQSGMKDARGGQSRAGAWPGTSDSGLGSQGPRPLTLGAAAGMQQGRLEVAIGCRTSLQSLSVPGASAAASGAGGLGLAQPTPPPAATKQKVVNAASKPAAAALASTPAPASGVKLPSPFTPQPQHRSQHQTTDGAGRGVAAAGSAAAHPYSAADGSAAWPAAPQQGRPVQQQQQQEQQQAQAQAQCAKAAQDAVQPGVGSCSTPVPASNVGSQLQAVAAAEAAQQQQGFGLLPQQPQAVAQPPPHMHLHPHQTLSPSFSYFSRFSLAPDGDVDVSSPGEAGSTGAQAAAGGRPHLPMSPSMAAALPISLMAELGLVDMPCCGTQAANTSDRSTEANLGPTPPQQPSPAVLQARAQLQAAAGTASAPWQLGPRGAHGHLGLSVVGEHVPGVALPRVLLSHQQAPVPLAASESPPAHFVCPLTRHIMSEPVVCSDGFLYERKAIADWLGGRSISPMTGQPLPDQRLVMVLPLRAAIMEWCRLRDWA